MKHVRALLPRDNEDGSLPFAMIGIIVVAGILTALMSQVFMGQRTARDDRDFNAAVQVADAGIQSAYATLANMTEAERPPLGDSVTITGTAGSGDYEWTAKRVSTNYWQVTSVGTHGGYERRLEAEIGERLLFPLAAFADISLTMIGGNVADSYDENGTNTGQGIVGSNQSITLNGNATVDWVARYNSANYNGGGDVLGGVSAIPDQMSVPNLGAAAYEEDGDCYGVSDGAYTGGTLTYGQTYCFTNVSFPSSTTTLSGNRDDGPVTIYIAPGGDLELKGQGSHGAQVNLEPIDAPDSTGLLIYIANGEVIANNHTAIAAGIYAPTSNCSGANAQADIYGSLVCRSLDGKGGWQFHYDARLSNVTDQIFSIVGWREETVGTTSFGGG